MKKARWISAVGGANAGCAGGAASNTAILDPNGGGSDNGNAGILSAGSGNTVNTPVSAPVDVCGIAAAVAGFANSSCLGGAFSNTLVG